MFRLDNEEDRHRVFIRRSGWLMFRFDNEEDRHRVLDNGPYLIFRRPLIMKRMLELFEFEKKAISRPPVLVTLPSIGFFLALA